MELTWKSKLDEAILFRQKSSQVFEMSVVAREEFLATGGNGGDNRAITGVITCANPFGKRIFLTFNLCPDNFLPYISDTRWEHFVSHWMCGRLVDREREGPSVLVLPQSDNQGLGNDVHF